MAAITICSDFGTQLTKHDPLEKRNCKSFQYFFLENPKNSMKRQKDRTLKDELPGLVVAHHATGISGEITPERMKRQSQSENNTQFRM